MVNRRIIGFEQIIIHLSLTGCLQLIVFLEIGIIHRHFLAGLHALGIKPASAFGDLNLLTAICSTAGNLQPQRIIDTCLDLAGNIHEIILLFRAVPLIWQYGYEIVVYLVGIGRVDVSGIQQSLLAGIGRKAYIPSRSNLAVLANIHLVGLTHGIGDSRLGTHRYSGAVVHIGHDIEVKIPRPAGSISPGSQTDFALAEKTAVARKGNFCTTFQFIVRKGRSFAAQTTLDIAYRNQFQRRIVGSPKVNTGKTAFIEQISIAQDDIVIIIEIMLAVGPYQRGCTACFQLVFGIQIAAGRGAHADAGFSPISRQGNRPFAIIFPDFHIGPIAAGIFQFTARAIDATVTGSLHRFRDLEVIVRVIGLLLVGVDTGAGLQLYLSRIVCIARHGHTAKTYHSSALAVNRQHIIAVRILGIGHHKAGQIPVTTQNRICLPFFLVCDDRRKRRDVGKAGAIAHSPEILRQTIVRTDDNIPDFFLRIAHATQIHRIPDIAHSVQEIAAGSQTACRHAPYNTILTECGVTAHHQFSILRIGSLAHLHIICPVSGQRALGHADRCRTGTQGNEIQFLVRLPVALNVHLLRQQGAVFAYAHPGYEGIVLTAQNILHSRSRQSRQQARGGCSHLSGDLRCIVRFDVQT